MRAEFGKLPERVRTMLAMWRFGRARVSEEEAEARGPTPNAAPGLTFESDRRAVLIRGPFYS